MYLSDNEMMLVEGVVELIADEEFEYVKIGIGSTERHSQSVALDQWIETATQDSEEAEGNSSADLEPVQSVQ